MLQDPKKENAVLLTVTTPQKNHSESFSSESEKREERTDPWEMVQGLQRTSDDGEGFQEDNEWRTPDGRTNQIMSHMFLKKAELHGVPEGCRSPHS